MRFRELKLRKDPDCPVCGTHPTVTKLIDYEQFCGVRPAAPEAPVSGKQRPRSSAVELKKRLDRGDVLTIVDVREPNEYQINRITGSIADSARRHPEALRRARPERRDRHAVQGRRRAARRRPISCGLKGLRSVLNLKGGILDWIDKVDPSQPKY